MESIPMENQACGFCRNPLLVETHRRNSGNKEANAQFQHTFPKLWRAKESPLMVGREKIPPSES